MQFYVSAHHLHTTGEFLPHLHHCSGDYYYHVPSLLLLPAAAIPAPARTDCCCRRHFAKTPACGCVCALFHCWFLLPACCHSALITYHVPATPPHGLRHGRRCCCRPFSLHRFFTAIPRWWFRASTCMPVRTHFCAMLLLYGWMVVRFWLPCCWFTAVRWVNQLPLQHRRAALRSWFGFRVLRFFTARCATHAAAAPFSTLCRRLRRCAATRHDITLPHVAPYTLHGYASAHMPAFWDGSSVLLLLSRNQPPSHFLFAAACWWFASIAPLRAVCHMYCWHPLLPALTWRLCHSSFLYFNPLFFLLYFHSLRLSLMLNFLLPPPL